MAQEDDQAVRQEVERRLQEIQLLEQEAKDQGRRSRFLREEELARKVRGESSASPYIFGAAWYSPVPLGGSAGVRVYVANSDPTSFSYLLVTLFFDGVSNFLSDIGLGPAGRNLEWPYSSTPPFSLASGSTSAQSFPYNIPTGIMLGTYIGNVILWAGFYFGTGTYPDRFFFDVTVT